MKKIIFFIFLFSCLSLLAFSAGLSGADFLTWDVGGRPSAMGGAFVGLSDDISALHWNPAGIANINTQYFSFMHLQKYADISYDYIGYIRPNIFKGSLGLSLIYESVDFEWIDWEGNSTSLDIYDSALIISYGKNLLPGLNAGINLKGIIRNFDEATSKGMAIDVGALYGFKKCRLFFGALVQNVGFQTAFYKEEDPLPLNLKTGIGFIPIENKLIKLSCTADISQDLVETDAELKKNLGVELTFWKIISFRTGYKFGYGENDFTAGVGVQVYGLQLDYAYAPAGYLGDNQRISITYNLDYRFITTPISSPPSEVEEIETIEQKQEEEQEIELTEEEFEDFIKEEEKFQEAVLIVEGDQDISLEREVYDIRIKIFSINFEPDKFDIPSEKFEDIEKLFKVIELYPDRYILIEGHADNTYTEQYNMHLSEKRAEAVAGFLFEKGVKPNRIMLKAYGETRPIEDNETEDGRAKNRRVEVTLIKK